VAAGALALVWISMRGMVKDEVRRKKLVKVD
jgi:hypothetical protein